MRIRANQGHSVKVDLGYHPALPPEELFHGTAERFLNSILVGGLVKANRHHEESLRMPFVIRWPGQIKAASSNKALVLNVDFAPTMLDAAGVKMPSDMQGRSFLPLLRGQKPEGWRTSMYYRYYHPGHHNVAAHYGIRTERYKLIYFKKLDQWELYDLKNDQFEMRNVYADPANAGLVTKLKTEMYRLKKDLKDEDQFQENLPRDDVGGGMARARP